MVQRHVLYLGEINSSQEMAWRRSIEAIEDGADTPRTVLLFPEDRIEGLLPDASIVTVKLSWMRLRQARQWGACWLALTVWQQLGLDGFSAARLPPSRKGTRWDGVLFVLVTMERPAPDLQHRGLRCESGKTAAQSRM
jgi:hypothetical protein